MVRAKPTKAKIEQWKKIFDEYSDKLVSNRKSGNELVEYLREKYDLIPFSDKKADSVIIDNVMQNKHYRNKLPVETLPKPITFYIEKEGKKIFVGIDLSSGMYHIEDDEKLWDELCAFQGLDDDDLKNYYCVAEYVLCCKKIGKNV